MSERFPYQCQRWKELPQIDLYMDQLVGVLEDMLSPFSLESQEKTITAAMINNYVKQKVVKPPKKKKYDRVHLAYLFAVCLTKRIMPLGEICDGMTALIGRYRVPRAYDMFCDELEGAFRFVYFGGEPPVISPDLPIEQRMIRSAALGVAVTHYARNLIESSKPDDSAAEKTD